ncbi:MAG: hypothetical protein ABIJ44_01805, partial [Pseudomonadota bacterium]
MRYRWKLLILLLIISLIPIAVLRIFSVRHVQLLADSLVSNTRTRVINNSENDLRFLVDSYSAWIRSAREHIETVLMFQAREVEQSLAEKAPPPSKVYFEEDFNEGRNVPPDTTLSQKYSRIRPDGTSTLLRVSYSTQVFKVAPEVSEQDVAADIARLSRLTPMYERL